MQPVFEKQFSLRTNDFDCFGNILPCAVLDLFQTVAAEHAELLGAGFDDMLKEKRLWVLVKTKYLILQMPKSYQTVFVKTWPLVGGRISFRRESVITDEYGNTLIKGSSEWVVMHSEKRKLLPVKGIYNISEDLFCTEKSFNETKFLKVPDFETENNSQKIHTHFCDVDMNSHINNTKYANFLLNVINPDKEHIIKQLQIDYHKEIKSETEFFLFTENKENITLAKGINQNGELLFSAKVMFFNKYSLNR